MEQGDGLKIRLKLELKSIKTKLKQENPVWKQPENTMNWKKTSQNEIKHKKTAI